MSSSASFGPRCLTYCSLDLPSNTYLLHLGPEVRLVSRRQLGSQLCAEGQEHRGRLQVVRAAVPAARLSPMLASSMLWCRTACCRRKGAAAFGAWLLRVSCCVLCMALGCAIRCCQGGEGSGRHAAAAAGQQQQQY